MKFVGLLFGFGGCPGSSHVKEPMLLCSWRSTNSNQVVHKGCLIIPIVTRRSPISSFHVLPSSLPRRTELKYSFSQHLVAGCMPALLHRHGEGHPSVYDPERPLAFLANHSCWSVPPPLTLSSLSFVIAN